MGVLLVLPASWVIVLTRFANGYAKGEIGAGQRQGVTTSHQAEMSKLCQEVRELRRANEILRAASVFFAVRALMVNNRDSGIHREIQVSVGRRAYLQDIAGSGLYLLWGKEQKKV